MNEEGEGEGEEAMKEAGEKEALPPCMSSGGVDLAQKERERSHWVLGVGVDEDFFF